MVWDGFTEQNAADVRRVVADANAAIGANDIDGVLALFAGAARMLPPQGPPIEGQAALRAFFETWPTYKSSVATDIRVEGCVDLAVATCAVAITHVTPDGGERNVSANQMIMLHHQPDGQ
ncbi:MAG: DUF4440 domain-containing protein [Hyphomicrobiales bacterium]|nr:DUF4440 domain-containing protein [Hyphomicrobiales bacterium]